MRRLALVALVLLGGCVYYNGMYRAVHLASDAEKAEREGRTIQAQNLWGQVGVKADTVLARHPDSKWADDALYLSAKSRERLGDCTTAVDALQRLLATSPDPELRERATFLLGTCWQKLGNTRQASEAFAQLVNSGDSARRNEALFQHGRSLRLGGRYTEALDMLVGTSHPEAAGERAAALAGLGRLEESRATADSLIQDVSIAAPWDSIIVLGGRHDPAWSTRLVDRLIAMPRVTADQKSRWLVENGRLLADQDMSQALGRLAMADSVGQGTEAGQQARLATLHIRLEHTTDSTGLATLLQDYGALGMVGGAVGGDAQRTALTLYGVTGVLDSVTATTPQGDMQLFIAAEAARDTLQAPRLAAVAFRRILRDFESSPYAPKALLALTALGDVPADSATSALQLNWPASPYLALVEGEPAPAYAQLEDSLRRFSVRFRAEVRRANAGKSLPGREVH